MGCWMRKVTREGGRMRWWGGRKEQGRGERGKEREEGETEKEEDRVGGRDEEHQR